MVRNVMCAVGGLLVTSAAAYFIHATTSSAARAETFDSRWFTPVAQKADRIDAPQGSESPQMFFLTVPTAQTTVVLKQMRKLEAPAVQQDETPAATNNGVEQRKPADRDLPHNAKRRDKLPVGCEPSFSPVTVPAMANVSGRCLS